MKFGLFGFIPTLVLELHGSFEIGYSECVIIWYNIYVPKAVGTYTYTYLLSIFKLSRITLSKVVFSDLQGNHFLDHPDTFEQIFDF